MDINSIIIIISSFLIGSIPSAYLVGKKLKSIDLTKRGSRNTGVSNLTQNTTLYTSLPVIFFDLFIKGFLPIFLCSDSIFSLDISTKILCGMASLIGHNWSIFLNLKGGRGIATLVGIILAVDYNLFVIRSEETRTVSFMSSIKKIQNVGAKLNGIVINDLDTSKDSYYSYYYSYSPEYYTKI